MPYVITTTTLFGAVTRRAVATLDEAQAYVDQIDYYCEVPESGGTVGPLPDGTVIEVERVTWSDMAEDGGIQLRYDPPTHDGDYLHHRQVDELLALIDAFNDAQEGSR